MCDIDIDNQDYYEYDKPENTERTRARLIELRDMGMTDCGNQQFGVNGIMSGLYIEMVWRYTDEEFDDYLEWVKELVEIKKEV